MNSITRRRFLEDPILAAAAAATASIPARAIAAEEAAVSANDKITVGIIGCGIRGKQHASELARLPGCEIACVCDPDRDRADEVAGLVGKNCPRPKAVQDLRRILDDKSMNAVFVATPNHWHALAAVWATRSNNSPRMDAPSSRTHAQDQP